MTSQTPFDLFAASARDYPGQPVMKAPASAHLSYAPEGFSYTYAEAAAVIDALRDRYAGAGYGRGHRVALILENRPEMLFHWLALNALGATIVPINPDLKPEELRYQLEKSRSDLVVALPAYDALLDAGCPEGLPRAHPDSVPPGALSAPQAGTPGPDQECAILFTSGSSGLPKACQLSNEYFLTLAAWYVSDEGMGPMAPGAEVALTPLPLFHMNALGCTCLGMIQAGGCIVALDRFHARAWWPTVADSGATLVHALGVIPAILLKLPVDPAETAHQARLVFSPGVEPGNKQEFERRYNVRIEEGWAMTETGGAAGIGSAGIELPKGKQCIGKPYRNVDWRLVDDAGADVATGQPGELWVRARGADPRRGFFSGYLGDEAATAEAWEGGWFHTGDIMMRDDAGLFYFVDRKKSIVRRSGENISSLEVESALVRDPGIYAAAVAPAPDDVRGEEVLAFIVLSDPAPAALAGRDRDAALALVEAAAPYISYHKLPGWVVFTDALPLTSTKKLQRGVLKANAATAVEDGSAIDLRGEKGRFRTAGKPGGQS
ncbi:AMP-binding protein [Pseudodonghicola flavimaris]|uniref:AMP-binding protein n=1 Tax=Pseudodonghicola flavimaris TaxID=3050036 RepID=A0ABT7EY65_9RHOB|nr:AMP-binding protein [Pseudodonghicola flavimaris]MDK3017297.1 AMP-binding protein [Pseudodonghicola flavimaris]